MWHDIETDRDLLNYRVLASTVAQMIHGADGEPLSIGISGSWGSGKSSLVKMISSELHTLDEAQGGRKPGKYIYLEFNAWLYQGFDDARLALLQSVATLLEKEAQKRQTCLDKAREFAKRVNWLRLGKLVLPVAASAMIGGALAGPVGGVLSAAKTVLNNIQDVNQEDLEKLKTAYDQLSPELSGLVKEKESTNIPQEIEELRRTFQDTLKGLDVTLVVLVDDLDRCLPQTAISTLEAIRLLLFMKRAAFIIAADDQMIRNAVYAHFGNNQISEDMATSYFDKLIQVPIRIPRPGINEVKAYLALLFADKMYKNSSLTINQLQNCEKAVLGLFHNSWSKVLSAKDFQDAFKDCSEIMLPYLRIVDEIAPILTTAEQINGNPRLIKRFLNNLEIRETMAASQGITISYETLVKMQLFERCATTQAINYLENTVAESEDGKLEFITEAEVAIANGEDYTFRESSWNSDFIKRWIKLSPQLSNIDLRPSLYLSRSQKIIFASYDVLSEMAQELLEAVQKVTEWNESLGMRFKKLSETESRSILGRLMRQAKTNQWPKDSFIQAYHIVNAHPSLSAEFISFLDEIPAKTRSSVITLIPRIRDEKWAKSLLDRWHDDADTPMRVKRAIRVESNT